MSQFFPVIPISDICNFVKIRKRSFVQMTKKQKENELSQTVYQITTYEDLFHLLERYVSWFNYEIFTALVNTFLDHDHWLQIIWKSYEEKVKEYLSLGKGVRVVSSPTIRGLPEAVGTKVMVVKVEQEDHVHSDLMIFRKALAKALNQSDILFYLCTIATGCLELRFVIPDFLFDEIFPLTSQQINITLPNLGIAAIHCDTYHVKVSICYYYNSYYYIYSSLQYQHHLQYCTTVIYRVHCQVKIISPNINQYYIIFLEFHDRLRMENSSSSLHDACYRGSLSEVQWIVQKFGYVKYERGHHGWTPLHSAVYGGHLDVLHYLIDDNKCDPNVSDDEDITLLHMSSYKGHINIVTYLIDACNVLVNAVDHYNTTAVMYATLGGQDEVVNLLISKYQCDASVCSRAGHSLSLLACQSGQKKVIHILESLQLFNLQSVDDVGRGVIHYTCAGGSVELLEYLIQYYNLELTVQDNAGMTGLHIAAYYSSTEAVMYIMEKYGPQIALETDNNGDNAIRGLLANDHLPVHSTEVFAKLLTPLSHTKSFYTSDSTSVNFPTTKIYTIAYSPIKVSERVSLVAWILEQCSVLPHFKINATYFHGRSLAHTASEGGIIALMKVLEQYNANIDVLDNDGRNILHAACGSGHTHFVEYLIVNKAMDTSVTDNKGCTLLHHAALGGSLSLVKLLVEKHQLSPHQVDENGCLPLHNAANKGHTAIVEYFIVDQAMDISVTSNGGKSILHHAALGGSLSLVKLLVEKYQLSPHQVDQNGLLPLHDAADLGHTAIVKYFIVDQAMDISVTSNDGRSILHHAALGGSLSLVKLLVEKYQLISPHQVDKSGLLPLHSAAYQGHTAIVEYFIVDQAMDTSVTSNDGSNILHYAALGGSLSLVNYLWKNIN